MSSLFRFRLARLGRVRQIEEHRAREQWLAAEEIAHNHEQVLNHRRSALEAAEAELRERHADTQVDPSRVLLAERGVERALEAVERAAEHAEASRNHAEAQRAVWSERRADVRALEKLEEKRRAEHKAEAERVEARRLEEISLQAKSPLQNSLQGGSVAEELTPVS